MQEVEGYYIRQGVLLASYHKVYWVGLATEMWPNFYWEDNVVPGRERALCVCCQVLNEGALPPLACLC